MTKPLDVGWPLIADDGCRQEAPMECGHYPVNLSVLGHCRACDYEDR